MEHLVYGAGGDLEMVRRAGFDGVLQYGQVVRFNGAPDQPYCDEPEDWGAAHQADFLQLVRDRPGEALALYWSPALAKQTGTWGHPVKALAFNWYPNDRSLWVGIRWAYVPWMILLYRVWYRYADLPVYGTLPAFAGWDTEADRLARPAEPTYYWSGAMLRWVIWCYTHLAGRRLAGFIWFVWQHDEGMADDLSRHPEWWPVNGGRG